MINSQKEMAQPEWEAFVLGVADRFMLPPDLILGGGRQAKHVSARKALAGALREAGYSYPAIARCMGAGDHTTALWQVGHMSEREAAVAVEVAAEAKSAACWWSWVPSKVELDELRVLSAADPGFGRPGRPVVERVAWNVLLRFGS